MEVGLNFQRKESDDLNKSRERKLALNTLTSLTLQLTNVISGFILPRLILGKFGSNVNGLVNSISQFLGIITLLDMGVGAVVQSALYKPLAENNNKQISRIYLSASKFFKRVAMILVGYVIVLMLVFPILSNRSFDSIYTITLIGAISISTFAQYYFGIVNSILLSADQKGYIQYTAQIVTIIINTIACSLLIQLGGSIQLVKLTTSLVFLCRPLFLNWYVKKHYTIDEKISFTEEPIKQKWNGMAQHFASYVLNGTDNIVLTLFSTFVNVSIYSVYYIVIIGVKNTFLSMTNGFQSLFGEMIAKNEIERLRKFFGYVEWGLHTSTVLIFGCTGMLIVPFVMVYTKGITDANYIQPLFAFLITFANAGHCLRLPYNILILAAGHYKQTQNNYIIAMILNIVISVATVKLWGLVGVAIGTLIAMLYQTVWMAWYDSKNIIYWDFKAFLKQCGVDLLTLLPASLITIRIPFIEHTFFGWLLLALEVFMIWVTVVLIINHVFYKDKLLFIKQKVMSKLKLL